MLLAKYEGRQVHFYQLEGCEFYVIRGKHYVAALCRDGRSLPFLSRRA